MKNKKNTLSLISLLAGILALIYCIFINKIFRSSSTTITFTTPFVMHSEDLIQFIISIILIIAGMFGICTKSDWIRKIASTVAAFVCLIGCITNPISVISWLLLVIALSTATVHFLDRTPNKKIFFFYYKGDIRIIFDEFRPAISDVYNLVEKSELPKPPKKTVSSTTHKAAPVKTKKSKMKRKRMGYAISPNSKNFNKKRKRKNAKR